MLIFALIGIGFLAGWLANLILGGGTHPSDWGPVVIAGFIGSFVGGTLISFLFGDGFDIRPSGLIGSTIGAIILLCIHDLWQRRQRKA